MKNKVINFDKKYPLLPLLDEVVLPYMVISLMVGRDKSLNALDAAMKDERLIILLTQVDAQNLNPSRENLYDVGTVAEILQVLKFPDGRMKVIVEGISRCYISDYEDKDSYIETGIKRFERQIKAGPDIDGYRRALLDVFEKYIKLNKKVSREALTSAEIIDDISQLTDVISAHIEMPVEYKQSLLDHDSPVERISRLIELINGEIEVKLSIE